MATRYAVGSPFTWDTSNTANWSATSGGAGGASAPTSSDDVVFNASSPSATCGGAVCKSLTVNDYFVSIDGDVTCYGNFTLTTSGSTSSLALTIVPPVGGATVTSNGNTLGALTLIGGAAAGYTVTAANALNINDALTMPNGTNAVYLLLKESVTHYVSSVVTAAASSGTSRIYSSTGGTQATVSDGVGINTLKYLDVKDIAFTGGAIWAQGTGFVDSGNNTGFASSSASFDALFAQSLA